MIQDRQSYYFPHWLRHEPRSSWPMVRSSGLGQQPAAFPMLPGLSADLIQGAVNQAVAQIWPSVRQQIRADIPALVEAARPTIRAEVQSAAMTFGFVSLAAIGGLLAVRYFVGRKA